MHAKLCLWYHLRDNDLVKLYQELLDAGLLFFDEE